MSQDNEKNKEKLDQIIDEIENINNQKKFGMLLVGINADTQKDNFIHDLKQNLNLKGIQPVHYQIEEKKEEKNFSQHTCFSNILNDLYKTSDYTKEEDLQEQIDKTNDGTIDETFDGVIHSNNQEDADTLNRPSPEEYLEALKGLSSGLFNLIPGLNDVIESEKNKIEEDDQSGQTPVEISAEKNFDHKINSSIFSESQVNEEEKEATKLDNMKIIWEDDDEDRESGEDAVYSNEIDEINKSDNTENDSIEDDDNSEDAVADESDFMDEFDTDEFSDALGSMVGMLTNQLGNMFQGLQEKLGTITEELDNIEDEIRETDEEDLFDDEDQNENDHDDDEVYSLEFESPSDAEALDKDSKEKFGEIFQNLSSIEAVMKNLGISVEDLNIPGLINEIQNQPNEQTKPTSTPQKIESQANFSETDNANIQDLSKYIEDIIEELKYLAKEKEHFVILLDELQNAHELTFQILNKILNNYEEIPLTIIGTYEINKNQKSAIRGIKNKDLRLLLTKSKIEHIGKNFIIKKE